ncbi:MAG TPA: hypothetical protein VGR18_04900 [Rubrobacter sp.]|nr:hypothetical protein [Rubrobacter sp.]
MFGSLLRSLPTNARWAAGAAFLVFLLLGAGWVAARGEEAAGQGRQTANQATTASPPAATPSAASPAAPAFDELESLLDDASASTAAEDETGGIPGLGAVEVTGNLKNIVADGTFPCDGPSPDGDLVLWSCAHPSGGYAAEVVGDDPLTVFSVTATARGLPERDAEAFFGYVLGLCLEDEAALDPEAWVSGNVPSGGQTFSDGVEITVYGSKEARAMSVVSTDATLD